MWDGHPPPVTFEAVGQIKKKINDSSFQTSWELESFIFLKIWPTAQKLLVVVGAPHYNLLFWKCVICLEEYFKVLHGTEDCQNFRYESLIIAYPKYIEISILAVLNMK